MGHKCKGVVNFADSTLTKPCSQLPMIDTQLPLCRSHFIMHLQKLFRVEFKSLYKFCDPAYAALDPTGLGGVSEHAFLTNLACERIITRHNRSLRPLGKIQTKDIHTFLKISNLFQG